MTETRQRYFAGEDYLRKVSAFHEYMMAKPEFLAEYEKWLNEINEGGNDGKAAQSGHS